MVAHCYAPDYTYGTAIAHPMDVLNIFLAIADNSEPPQVVGGI